MAAGISAGPRKAMRQRNFNIIIFGYLFASWHFLPAASADTEPSKMRDCAEIELEVVIDHEASREDNLARLSQQFFQSVNTIEHCDREQSGDHTASSHDSNSAAGADGVGTAGDDSGAANSSANSDATSASSEQMTASPVSKNSANIDADNTAATTPIASGSLIGTNFDQVTTEPASAFTAPSAPNMAGTTPQPTPAESSSTEPQPDTTEQDPIRLTNGKTPDDIPHADDDSVFEAQIRAAAENETDPVIKKKLWNEYLRYKKLPEQE